MIHPDVSVFECGEETGDFNLASFEMLLLFEFSNFAQLHQSCASLTQL